MEKDKNILTSRDKIITELFEVDIFTDQEITKYYLNAKVNINEDPDGLLEKINSFFNSQNAQIVSQNIFGNCSSYESFLIAVNNSLGEIKWPITWIEGNNSKDSGITGMQIFAISGTPLFKIKIKENVVGNIFKQGNDEICFLGGLLPDGIHSTNEEQTADVLQKIESALNSVGMDFLNVVRTWFYVDNILDWYDEFNKVRTDFFNRKMVFDGLVPASTGIGVSNPKSAALVGEAIAIRRSSDTAEIGTVNSPLQCSAQDYKSSFSRAVEVKYENYEKLYVSGTASIDEEGNTIHLENVENQIKHTMKVVEMILKSRGLNWSDVNRAIAYFTKISDISLFYKFLEANSIPSFPVAIAKGDICRRDLLFEIEVDAIKIK